MVRVCFAAVLCGCALHHLFQQQIGHVSRSRHGVHQVGTAYFPLITCCTHLVWSAELSRTVVTAPLKSLTLPAAE